MIVGGPKWSTMSALCLNVPCDPLVLEVNPLWPYQCAYCICKTYSFGIGALTEVALVNCLFAVTLHDILCKRRKYSFNK